MADPLYPAGWDHRWPISPLKVFSGLSIKLALLQPFLRSELSNRESPVPPDSFLRPVWKVSTVRLMTQVCGWSIFLVFTHPQHFNFSSLIGNVSFYRHDDLTAIVWSWRSITNGTFPPFWSLVGHFSCEDGISQWKRAVFFNFQWGI